MIDPRHLRFGLYGLFTATLFCVAAPAQQWERWLQVPPQTHGGFRRQPVADPPPGATSLRYRFEARPSTLTRWADELDQERAVQEEIKRSSVTDPNQPPAFSEVSAINEQLLDAAIQYNAPWNATLGYRLDPSLDAAVQQTRAELMRPKTPVEPKPVASSAPIMLVASMPVAQPKVYQIAAPQVTIIPASIADQLASYGLTASEALGQAPPATGTP